MDILGQYEKQFPQENKPAPQWQPSSEYGFLINLIMRVSGGMIKDEAQATHALLGLSVLIIVLSVFFFLNSGNSNILPPSYKVDRALEDAVGKLQLP